MMMMMIIYVHFSKLGRSKHRNQKGLNFNFKFKFTFTITSTITISFNPTPHIPVYIYDDLLGQLQNEGLNGYGRSPRAAQLHHYQSSNRRMVRGIPFYCFDSFPAHSR